MRNIVALSVCLSALAVSAAEYAFSETEIVLARDNEFTAEAAQELAYHLKLIAAVDVPLVKTATAGKKQFVIGAPAPDDQAPVQRGEARYAIRAGQVFFWGYSKAGQFHGILNAVDFFLERKLGVTWLRPGEDGIVYQRQTAVYLPEQENFAWTLPFEMVGQRIGYWRFEPLADAFAPAELRPGADDCAVRTRDNDTWMKRLHHGVKTKFRYGHAYTDWWDLYGKDHPEYFGMNPYGKRTIPQAQKKTVKLCVSNPAVADKVVAVWQEKGAGKFLNVCPNDGTPGYCFCPACRQLDVRRDHENFYDHLTDRELYFWNRVAERAVKIRPDVMLVAYIYSYYRQPARREKVEFPDHMLFGIVPNLADDNEKMFAGWKALGAKNVFLRPNDLCYRGMFFRGCDQLIYDKFQTARQFNLWGTDYDCGPGNPVLDFEHFVVGRMIAFPERTFAEIEDEYCAAFGKAAAAVKAFYAFHREDGARRHQAAAAELRQQGQELLDDDQMSARIVANAAKFFSRERMLTATAILESALLQDDSDAVRTRLGRLLLAQQHAVLLYDFMTQGQLSLAGQANTLEEAARKLLDFRTANRSRLVANWPNAFAGSEKKIWLQTARYAEKAAAGQQEAGRSPLLFRNSFDLPDMDGWLARDRFVEISQKTASFDKFSLRLAADVEEGIGIFKPQVELVPGRYSISFDACMDAGVEHVRLRVAAGGAGTLASAVAKPSPDGDFWVEAETGFEIKAGVSAVSLYVVVGPGKAGLFAFVDNIVLRRLE